MVVACPLRELGDREIGRSKDLVINGQLAAQFSPVRSITGSSDRPIYWLCRFQPLNPVRRRKIRHAFLPFAIMPSSQLAPSRILFR
jgi:hypothetical protein